MEHFKVFDFHRIFFGELPYLFLLEIVMRTVIMYLYAVFLLRVLGKRGMGQLSTLELAIIICFGSAIGDPMMGVEVPLIHGMAVVTVVALLQMGLERLINKNPKAELIMEGKPDLVVSDGAIICKELTKNNLSQEDLFRFLRNKDVQHLGEIRQAFFETTGVVSVMFHAPKNIKRGLSIVPREYAADSFESLESVPSSDEYSCKQCGLTEGKEVGEKFGYCQICKQGIWTLAAKGEG